MRVKQETSNIAQHGQAAKRNAQETKPSAARLSQNQYKVMPNVRLFHWRAKDAKALIAKLRAAGYQVSYNGETQSSSVRQIRELDPAAIIIDLSRMPSHGRYVAAWVRGSKALRFIPLVFTNGAPEKVAAIRKEVPDATYTETRKIAAALKAAIANPPRDPARPTQMMESYGHRTAAEKLGIRENCVVGLIDPPGDYLKVLGSLPDGVIFEESRADALYAACPVTLWFVHQMEEYKAEIPARRLLAARTQLWILWRKGRRDGLNSNSIREIAIAMGLVDYKICSLNDVWTGMVFTVKRPRK
jgi:hypothetical protein